VFVILSIFFIFYNPLLLFFLAIISAITLLMDSGKRGETGIFSKIKILLIINSILLYALLSYPFGKGTSRYKKTK